MIIAVTCGAIVAVQSRITGELGRQLGDGYLAALLAFLSGLVILATAMVFWAPGRQGLARAARAVRFGSVPWWHFTGGAAGAFFVLSQGLTAALLGVALFTVAAVCGQTISGLLIDRNGLGTVLPKAITYTRLIGSVVAFCAVIWAVSAQLVGDIPIWALAMPFFAGLGAGWQQAVNGQVRGVSGSALTATAINFVVGTMVLLVATVIHGATAGWPTQLPSAAWLYLGGPIGVVFIAAAAILVRIIGVLLLGLGTVAGQLTASLLIDVTTPIPGHAIAWTTIAGTILTLLAVVFAAIPSRAIRPPKAATER
jgi:transporter family-2 protein